MATVETREVTMTLIVSFEPQYIEDMKVIVESAGNLGTVVSAKVLIPADTEIDLA